MKLFVILIKMVLSILAIILALNGGYLLFEGVYIGLIADNETLGRYGFGSEAWVQGIGWHFKSKWHFLLSGFLKSLTMFLPAGVIIYSVIKFGRENAI